MNYSLYSFAGLLPQELEEHLFFEKKLSKKIKLYVFDRDNWSCRSCNNVDGISPHHIIPRSSGRDHSPNNLVTLCFSCHRAVHDGFLDVVIHKGNFFFGRRKGWR